MVGRVEGKVALITGAARGQGRSHAVRLAEEGANIIAVDLCQQIESVPYDLASPAQLEETVGLVEATGQKILATEADVRDFAALKAAVDAGVSAFGRLDIVSANAGICSFGSLDELDERSWQDMIDVNLTGAWHTAKAGIPHLRATGGGSIILTSSLGGLVGMQGIGHYVAAKHGLVGLMRTLALELGASGIRVNTVHPTNVDTDMLLNQATFDRFGPDLPQDQRTQANLLDRFVAPHALQIPWVEAVDVSNAVLWLASNESRYVTGATIPIDGGAKSM